MKTWLIRAYLIAIHALIIVLLMKTDAYSLLLDRLHIYPKEFSDFYHETHVFHRRVDQQLPEGMTLFVGDSLVQGLDVGGVQSKSINFGIGGDTSLGVLQRIGDYQSLKQAQALVLAVGLNDLKYRTDKQILDHFDQILAKVPRQTPIVLSAIHLVDELALSISARRYLNNERIEQINRLIKNRFQHRENLQLLDTRLDFISETAQLKPSLHIGDGVHLNARGYQLWQNRLKSVLMSTHSREIEIH